MRVIKPQRLSILQRVFEVRGERLLALGLTAFVPFDAPETALPEISMWQALSSCLGKDMALDEGSPKPRGELLVLGKAFAPGGKPRPAFQARARLGPTDKPLVDKAVFVIGKRRWVRGVPSDPEPLTELMLGWDKAFGGPGFALNPSGMGYAPVDEGGQKVHWLPQLEDPKHLITSPGDRPPPAGFGAIDVTSPERQGKLGTYDAKWLENEFPGLARDFDPEFFMVAPRDLRLPDFFRAGDAITLENLHPEEGTLTTRVPDLVGRCFVSRRTPDGEVLDEVATRLDTLVLLPNARRMIAVYRGVARVAEDDAADVSCLLAALERRDAPRSADHYREVLAQRLDKKKGHLVALRDRDLLPEPDPNAPALPDEKFSDMEDLLKREGVMERRARERMQRELDAARLQARVLGIDPDEKGIPREVAPPEPLPNVEDLAAYVEQVEKEAARLEAESKTKQDEAIENARRSFAEHGVDLDAALERAKTEGGGPPKFRAEEHLAQLRETARVGRELGAPMEPLEDQIEDPTFITKLRQLEEIQLSGYRTLAHFLPAARPLEDVARRTLRERVEEALRAGTSMAGWDLTGADLRGLDLSKALLAGALLELADLREATLSGADLSGAVLVRANLEGVRFAGANLAGANLGEIHASGADFADARLSKAVLYRGDLAGASLRGADLTGADLFEARLPGVDLSGAAADELLFYDCDLEGAKLDGARLRKATFFRCRLGGASFVEAVLESTGFVEVRAPRAVFRGARATKMRFVLECELSEADFSAAEIPFATIRGVALPKARFEGTRGDGCDLSGSDLREACLRGASLEGARLVRSDLAGADVSDANLMESLMQNAKLAGATFARANLFRANLMGAIGDDRTSFEGAHVVRALFDKRRRA